ncbi:shikimate dehydrogenase [Campylobacter iguaniorum]|uniref:Shikimate dehydrogenase (NADP(+)) n=1 Tax=Campylobacter iguaniorum TaxID=1244531 RepID=A0A076FC63_9BACT|nr:shikimate dehydrogenase [Campylobacter iguaniorum]AII15017.1 shikimate dehydrogenase [Campylobacter iguaniorum]ALV24845.1 shikimate dehydrogenase [Campylobacter iguaniorum]
MNCYAVFGNPIAHSISPRLHNLAICGLGLDDFYGRVCLQDSSQLTNVFNKLSLKGANITIPFKEVAFAKCDELDQNAKKIGSVNTIVKKENKLYGFNTDAPGFMMAISDFGKVQNALVIGAGGTSKAISYILQSNGIDVDVVNRSQNRADEFKDYNFFSFDEYEPKSYDLVVNTTPAGLVNNELPMQETTLNSVFSNSKFAFDVIYGRQTPFLNLAKQKNLQVKDGADMLLFQAVLAFNLFYDNSFDLDVIKGYMKEAFTL